MKALLLAGFLLFAGQAWANDATCPSGPVFTDDYTHREGFDLETQTKNSEDAVNNDVFWESTGYQFGGHGTIYGFQSESEVSYLHSRILLISETDLRDVTLATCSGLNYGELDDFSRVSDGQVVCVSEDSNADGSYGDRFAAVRLNSHVDEPGGLFAASANLSIVLLETSDPAVCDDGNPCTADSCSLAGTCSAETDLVLCGETLAPCAGPDPNTAWKNHGEYMKALAQATKEAVKNGDITAEERDAILNSGSNSDCGQ